MLSFAYRVLTDLGAPVISFYLSRRRREGREDAARFTERLGKPSVPRLNGKLVWCHAASVGEATSLLTLIEKIHINHPTTQILLTTGTVSSARMMEGRLPPQTVHQYIPVDRIPYVERFLDFWKPDLVLWIESELWPNMLASIKRRMIPAVLLNARMSEKSFHNWWRAKKWVREILSSFSLCLSQTEDDRSRFVALGAKPTRCLGNLKYASKPLPVDEKAFKELQTACAGRPVWLMASTHRGEDEIAFDVHLRLREKFPNLLTIIVPRHAARGGEIARSARAKLQPAQRSQNDAITPQTELYIADTMGELGLFYRLSPIAFIGGSFVPIGGHNPIEAAQLGCAIIFGPHMHNFRDIAKEFTQQQAAIQLKNSNELPFTVERFLSTADERGRFANAARTLADQKRHILDQVLDALQPWLNPPLKSAA